MFLHSLFQRRGWTAARNKEGRSRRGLVDHDGIEEFGGRPGISAALATRAASRSEGP